MQKESGACEVVIPSIVSSLFCALRVCVPMQGWYQGCDAWVRKVAGAANGLLFQQLLEATGYCDVDCVNMLRHGADMLGVLKRSGIGAPLAVEEAKCSEQLRKDMAASNRALLQELREDELSHTLMKLTLDDASLGRMTHPQLITDNSSQSCLLCPRFGVQQLKPDGRVKVRAVDNFSWAPGPAAGKAAQKLNSVNGHTMATEKLSHEALDQICAAMQELQRLTDSTPGLWKADVDSAFRRVPINPQQRWCCGIAFKWQGKVRLPSHDSAYLFQCCVCFLFLQGVLL